MSHERRRVVADTLRQRIVRGLESGALEAGSRLPGVRQIGAELGVDPRVVVHAYRRLAEDGLVDVRPRSGAFVASLPATPASHRDPPASWLADVVADGILRGIPAPSLARSFGTAAAGRRLTAVVVAGILDQVEGLARELREDYGVAAAGILIDEIGAGERLPRAVVRAHFLVTTPANEPAIRRLAQRLNKPHVVIGVRPDMLSVEWQSMMRRTVYVVVADPRFAIVVRNLVGPSVGAPNVSVLVAGKDDVGAIPPDSPTYVTESARLRLGRTRLPGRLIIPVRILSDDSVREIARLVVRLNLSGPRTRAVSRR